MELELRVAVHKAISIMRDIPKAEIWPEDEWFYLFRTWDLNLWSDEDGARHAAIYRVRDGHTLMNPVYVFGRTSHADRDNYRGRGVSEADHPHRIAIKGQ